MGLWLEWPLEKTQERGWRDLEIRPLTRLPEVFLERTHTFQKCYLRKMHRASEEISTVTLDTCCWMSALSFTSLSSATMCFLGIDVPSSQDDGHTYPPCLATPWRRWKLLGNPWVGSVASFAQKMGSCHVNCLPHPVSMLSHWFFWEVTVGQYSPPTTSIQV